MKLKLKLTHGRLLNHSNVGFYTCLSSISLTGFLLSLRLRKRRRSEKINMKVRAMKKILSTEKKNQRELKKDMKTRKLASHENLLMMKFILERMRTLRLLGERDLVRLRRRNIRKAPE